MIPKIIHVIAVTDKPLSPLQEKVIAVARELHPRWEIKVWRDPVPSEGFQLAHYWSRAKSAAQLADLMRLDIIYKYGGVYIDSDVLLKKALDDPAHHLEFFVASEDGCTLTNAAFGARAEHPALESLIQNLLESEPEWSLPPNITTGPQLFSRVLKWRRDVTLLPRESFYPYGMREQRREGHLHTYGEHLWAGSWATKSPMARLRRELSRVRPKRVAKYVRRRVQAWRLTNEFALRFTHSIDDVVPCAPQIIRRTIHGHTILLDGNDGSITPEVASKGYYELSEEMFLRRVLRGGDFFVDVGANVGILSMLAASLVGPFGRVFAYEPNPNAAALLRKSAGMNWMHERIMVQESAVGATEAHATLTVYRDRTGDSSLVDSPTKASPHDAERITVPVVALDKQFPYDISIKTLKIDAEGFEAEVLKGASRLIERQCIDYILLEAIEEASGNRWRELLGLLEEICAKGYRPFSFGRHGKIIPTTIAHVMWFRGRGRNIVLRSTRATA